MNVKENMKNFFKYVALIFLINNLIYVQALENLDVNKRSKEKKLF